MDNFFAHLFKNDSDYQAFKETTWWYSKFIYCSTILCQPVPPRSQPIQICCTTITNMQTELRYVTKIALNVKNHIGIQFYMTDQYPKAGF